MRQAREHHPGEVWKTPDGKWRSKNPSGDAKSFDAKEQADAHAKPKKDTGSGDGGEGKGKGFKALLSSFLEKAKDLAPSAKEALKRAPQEAQRLVVDKEHRKEATTKAVEVMKKGAKAIPTLLKNATKEELHEIKHGVSAVKKVFKKPPEKLTGPDKKALYAVGVYVVAGTVMAATGGLAAMAGTLGNSFAKHVAFKAVSHILDQGFTHFEVGHSLLHGLHHFSDHLASERVALRHIFGEGASEEELQEILLTYMYQAIHDVLDKGLTDEDMEKVLEAVNEKTENVKTASVVLPMSDPTWESYTDEVMDYRMDGVTPRQLIREAMRSYVKIAQETNGKIETAIRAVEDYSGMETDYERLESLVRKEIRFIWGDDPGRDIFAKMFARGKFIY